MSSGFTASHTKFAHLALCVPCPPGTPKSPIPCRLSPRPRQPYTATFRHPGARSQRSSRAHPSPSLPLPNLTPPLVPASMMNLRASLMGFLSCTCPGLSCPSPPHAFCLNFLSSFQLLDFPFLLHVTVRRFSKEPHLTCFFSVASLLPRKQLYRIPSKKRELISPPQGICCLFLYCEAE